MATDGISAISGDLFSCPPSIPSPVLASLKTLDVAAAATELQYGLNDLKKRRRAIEEAKVVSQELLASVISL